MKAGDIIETPRFLMVKIRSMYANVETLRADGYTEPTHYRDPEFYILGKTDSKGENMFFAAAPRYEDN